MQTHNTHEKQESLIFGECRGAAERHKTAQISAHLTKWESQFFLGRFIASNRDGRCQHKRSMCVTSIKCSSKCEQVWRAKWVAQRDETTLRKNAEIMEILYFDFSTAPPRVLFILQCFCLRRPSTRKFSIFFCVPAIDRLLTIEIWICDRDQHYATAADCCYCLVCLSVWLAVVFAEINIRIYE